MSGLYEVATWLVYALAALMMLAAIATAILAGLALRFVAEFLHGLGDNREGATRNTTRMAREAPRERRATGLD